MWNEGNGQQVDTSATNNAEDGEEEEDEDNIFHWQDSLMREVGKTACCKKLAPKTERVRPSISVKNEAMHCISRESTN